MKRDMNLVREILLAIEASPSGFAPGQLKINGYTEEQVGYHLYLMMEAGLVHGADITTRGGASP